MNQDFLFPPGVVGALVVVGLFLLGWLIISLIRRSEKRSEAARQARQDARAAKLDAKVAEDRRAHEQMLAEIEQENEEWEMHLAKLRRETQREKQRRMPRVAREMRRRVPSRKRYPVAAGVGARMEAADREWKSARSDQPTHRRTVIATLGPFRLSKLSSVTQIDPGK